MARGSRTSARTAPPSLDVPSQRGGFVVKEHARLAVLWRTPHVQLAPHLEAIVTDALSLAGDRLLAYPRPSGDWLEPMPRPKLVRHVRAIAKQISNATMSLSSLDQDATFALEYRAYLPIWIEGRAAGRPGLPTPRRGKASFLQVTFPREALYERPAEVTAVLTSILARAPFSAATVGLSLEGHYAHAYPLGLRHLALDLSDLGCVTDDVGDDLHNIAWLTVLGDQLIARLGGRTKLARALAGHGDLVDVPGGVLVRLGDRPSRGSTEPAIAPYRALARCVGELLHSPREVSYFTCGFDNGSERYAHRDDEMQAAWHHRLMLTREQLRAVFAP